jgi:hypothetical protein
VAYGPQHLFKSCSLLGLAVTEPFLAKTAVQNTNLDKNPDPVSYLGGKKRISAKKYFDTEMKI